ncbi:hypothetical protein EFS57_09790 [Leuconostoc falkenbergense]|nr:hypothetical protein [Leuconostoc falkenbergense]
MKVMEKYYVMAISTKDEKNIGKGYAKFIPILNTSFWGSNIPGARFEISKLGQKISQIGIYELEIQTSNLFTMPRYEITSANFLANIDDIIDKKSIKISRE